MAGIPARIGPYQIVGEIGRGGMGVVLRAKDPSLDRDLAIKVLAPGASDVVRERFLREGRTCGRLRHPHIVSVYAAGVDGDTAYLAQDLIEGESLAQHLDAEPMTPMRAANVVERIARALHYAHSEGVIHRDVKPANILLDTAGLPHLADFGLARDIESSEQLSKSGEVLGTPHYVSPEQGSGQLGRVDGRTDIWACGVVLYECLAGVPPFDGDSAVGVLREVIHGEPAPLSRRVAGIPRPLELIVHKCLEKEPERRYRSADLLAQDLARFQRGEPVHARAPSAITQVKRFFGRRRTGVAALAGGALALAIGIGIAVPAMRASDAASLRRLTEVSTTSLDAALALRRAGDLAGARRFAERVETACADALTALPGSAEPHYQLGRMYRVLQHDAAALDAQTRALAADPDHLPARYERLVLGAERYVEALVAASRRVARELADTDAEVTADEAARRSSRESLTMHDPAAKALHAQMLDDLARLEANFRTLGPAAVRCAQGLRAWADNDLDAARTHLEAALAADPDLSTAREMLGRVEREDGNEAAAVACLSRGLERDRANLRMLAQRTRARTELIEKTRDRDENPASAIAAALLDTDRWLALAPGSPDALLLRSRIHKEHASQRRDDGVYDPSGYESAIVDADAVLASDPTHAEAWTLRASAHNSWAYTAAAFNEDPVPLYEAAISDFTRAIELDPGDDYAWRDRAGSRRLLGEYVARAGGDPAPHYAAALADLEGAGRADPTRAQTHYHTARLHRVWGDALHRRKLDPSPQYAAGVAAAQRARALRPAWMAAANRLLYTREAWIDALRDRQEDFSAQFTATLEELAAAEQRWPTEDRWARHLGALFIDQAFDRAKDDAAGRRADYTAAIQAYDRAIALDPDDPDSWEDRGRAANNRANSVSDRGEAVAGYQAAVDDYSQAIALRPTRYLTWYFRGNARHNMVRAQMTDAFDPIPAYTAARDDYDAALRLDPKSRRTFEARTGLYGDWLRRLVALDAPATEVIAVARAGVRAMQEHHDRCGPLDGAQREALRAAEALLKRLEDH